MGADDPGSRVRFLMAILYDRRKDVHALLWATAYAMAQKDKGRTTLGPGRAYVTKLDKDGNAVGPRADLGWTSLTIN